MRIVSILAAGALAFAITAALARPTADMNAPSVWATSAPAEVCAA
jgi:hypothetical protein